MFIPERMSPGGKHKRVVSTERSVELNICGPKLLSDIVSSMSMIRIAAQSADQLRANLEGGNDVTRATGLVEHFLYLFAI